MGIHADLTSDRAVLDSNAHGAVNKTAPSRSVNIMHHLTRVDLLSA